jgi:hypothetical protein
MVLILKLYPLADQGAGTHLEMSYAMYETFKIKNLLIELLRNSPQLFMRRAPHNWITVTPLTICSYSKEIISSDFHLLKLPDRTVSNKAS